jgi:hypothetical protein
MSPLKAALALVFMAYLPILWAQPAPPEGGFLETFPHLKPYVYEEPKSGFFLGLGLSPVGILGNSMMFSANFFELHWIRDRYDVELLNASYAFTRAETSEFQSTHFTFRTSWKYRFFGPISAGPLIGYEYVSFPGIGARIFQGGKIQPSSEPFSSEGWIYGAMVSETFKYEKDYLIKINELAYEETYSTTHTAQGWTYIYDDQSIQQDNSKIKAGTVIMIEGSFLY